jgi:hypothetical protein
MMHDTPTFTKVLARHADLTFTVPVAGGLDSRPGHLLDTGDQVSPSGVRDGEDRTVWIG